MSILSWLALLFVGIPLLELFVLIQLGQIVGLWPTIGVVVLTGFLGASLARHQGLRTLWQIQGELARGRLPGTALFDGLAILVGGALLLTPGILTDLLGFSFLLPFTRRLLLRRIRKSLEAGLQRGTVQVIQFGRFGSGFGMGGFKGAGMGEGSETEESPPRTGEIVVEPREPRERGPGDRPDGGPA